MVSTRVTTFLFGLLRGAVSLRAFLRRLCDAITDPIIETLGASERYIPLDDLQSKLQENMHRIMRQALGLDHDNHAVSVLKKFVGNLIWIGLRAALGALSFVIERRLKNAVPPGRPMQLSVPAAVAVLREEVLGAVMAPIRRSLQMYLVATIFTSAVLMCAPFYILKWFSQ